TLPSIITHKLTLENFSIAEATKLALIQSKPVIPLTPVTQANPVGEPVVEMKDLTIAYSGKKIISDLNWRVNKGERWALTGKNGSRKTTLFSLIYADHPMAYSQKVFLFGKRRGSGESIWDIKKRINYMGPEQMHFLDHRAQAFTGREYITMQAHKNPE